jgi:hypothetical protein
MTKKIWPLAFWLLASCATATVVETSPGVGGVISVKPAQDPEARQKARALMVQTCGRKRFKIVKEGRVAVGTETTGSSTSTPQDRKQYNLFTGKSKTVTETNTDSSSTTSNVYEWHLTYRCGG